MKRMRVLAGTVVIICVLVAEEARTAETKPLVLENERLALSIQAGSGGLTEIKNKLSGETYRIDDPGFMIEAGEGKKPGTLGQIRPTDCRVMEARMEGATARVVLSRGALKITVSYQLEPSDDFAEKRLRVDYTGRDSYNISRVDLFDFALDPAPAKAIPYYGYLHPQPLPDTDAFQKSVNSTAFFMRYGEGGLFTMAGCDFVAMEQDAAQRCRSHYWPGLILPAGKTFESERALVGVYRRAGYFHQPYNETADLASFLFPNVDERLDRAEVDAARTAVEKFLKPERFAFVANGWAMGLPHMITNSETLKEYRHAIELTKKLPQVEALHFIHNLAGVGDEFTRTGLAAAPVPNPYVREALDYAREQHIGISTFLWTSQGQPAPKIAGLLTLDADGQRVTRNLALTEEYTGFVYDTFRTVGRNYPQIMGLSCDFLNIRPDYDPEHGYLPGTGSLHAQWANVRDMLGRLRHEFPDWMLRTQAGFSGLGPWLSEHASFVHNAHDPNIVGHRNFLDFHASYQYANNLRLAAWFAANTKMFPRHMMNDFIVHKNGDYKAWDYGAWEYCVLSRLASGCGFGMLNGTPDFDGGEIFPEAQYAFLDKWVTWQREHREYYVRAASLFGEPRPSGIDGIAYGNRKDSVIFACNPTFEKHSAAIPIGPSIHLPEGPAYMIRELYPEERYRIGPEDGAFRSGTHFIAEIPAQTIAVFEVKPLNEAETYLIGLPGRIEQQGSRTVISGVSGPTGRTRQFAVRLPAASKAESIHIGGKSVPVSRQGKLLIGRVQFAGKPVTREISGWTFDGSGNKPVFTAEFFVPEDAREILARQALPVTRKFRGKTEVLNSTAWLDWSRFIIHIPVLPEGAKPELPPYRWTAAAARASQKATSIFGPVAYLNGGKAELHSNLMRPLEHQDERPRLQRWSGFFIDASTSIEYGKTNSIKLEFPSGSKPGYVAAYLPNLTPPMTRKLEPLPAPAQLLIDESQDAAEAYPAVPLVEEHGDGVRLYIKATLTAAAETFTSNSIAVEGGQATGFSTLSPLLHGTAGRTKSLGLTEAGARASFRFELKGIPSTRVVVKNAAGNELIGFTIQEVLDGWRKRQDRFETLALEVPVRANASAPAVIELVGPEPGSVAVKDTL